MGLERGTKKEYYYTDERNAQILISLLKEYGIKKVVASPGYANASFVYSIQQDGGFEIYSSVDERSAAYIACGMAEESGEPVVLSCTGATASRNYLPGLTEAFYRKLPILAVTSSQPISRIGNNTPQMIDRRSTINDTVKISVNLGIVKDAEDEMHCIDASNNAILELFHHGAGPVHINLETCDVKSYNTKYLPKVRKIQRVCVGNMFPEIDHKRVAIFVGAHSKWERRLTDAVDSFCEKYNAVVLCDHTSNYKGLYGVQAALLNAQKNRDESLWDYDLLIHLGNVSGAYYSIKTQHVWRVNPDGKICNTFGALDNVFEMDEIVFFEQYVRLSEQRGEALHAKKLQKMDDEIRNKIPELPFSNLWIASVTADKFPDDSILHLGILNSLRSWNFFHIPQSVHAYTNTGGFGIDGCVSSLIGASMMNPEVSYYGVVGDLAFFYDLNSLGNRHIGANLCLIVVNNGCGQEFKNYGHTAALFGEQTDTYIAAKGHYGNKSDDLVKNYAENLGFEYYVAHTKEEYKKILPEMMKNTVRNKPMLVEVFTNSEDESESLKAITTICGNEEFVQEKSKQNIKPNRVANMGQRDVVLWGTGGCFLKNLSVVKEYANVRTVCDNNSQKWGEEVLSGVRCISPDELSTMDDVFVVIMLEDWKLTFQIANQLLNMGIDAFDSFYNWITYAEDLY